MENDDNFWLVEDADNFWTWQQMEHEHEYTPALKVNDTGPFTLEQVEALIGRPARLAPTGPSQEEVDEAVDSIIATARKRADGERQNRMNDV